MPAIQLDLQNRPEVWVGIECTVNRIGDRFMDQCRKSGHDDRLSDLGRIASLGGTRVRYPFLWEKVAPLCSQKMDWTETDRRVDELRRLGLRPIAGFVHHGSGPAYTHLLDPEFPEKLADYAGSFARRYSWIEDYTPINEPLTTARFSALYGVWYPHARDDRSFLRALYQQIRATILAMARIREVVSTARLIQTEDLGIATSTPLLREQREFENERRWLGFDLLQGRVVPDHPLYLYLVRNGVSEDELDWLVESAIRPEVIGVNHYPLSNRFLDERVDLYPSGLQGGNGQIAYADVGAVDTGAVVPPSPQEVFRQAWERYRLAVAVTEVHIAGPREAQMQWLHEIWESACALRREGIPVVAVTAWSAFGSYDWNSLCARESGFYESGLFDVRSGQPRPTALAKQVRSLASEGVFTHPVLEQRGWWHHPERVRFARELMRPEMFLRRRESRPVLITGAGGTLGRAFARICAERGWSAQALDRRQLDLSDPTQVREALNGVRPWAVINCAGFVDVDAAELDRDRCFRENAIAPWVLATETERRNIRLMTFSSDLVFDGDQERPYLESGSIRPLNFYGQSKAEAELRVLNEHPDALVIRTSSFFGPWDEANFMTRVLRSILQRVSVPVLSDVTVTPTYIPDLVHACLDLLLDGERGVVHLSHDEGMTWEEMARRGIQEARRRYFPRMADHLLNPRPLDQFGLAAARPRYSALRSERVRMLPDFGDALERYFRELQVPLSTPFQTGWLDWGVSEVSFESLTADVQMREELGP